jgi:YD repeat-containing protein
LGTPAISNRTEMTDGEGVTTYTYDALDRLMQATYPTDTVTYTLDSVGNRLSDGGNTFTYDPSDRILNPGYVYDANGNLLGDGTATYEYDAANRLIQMTKDGVVTTYGYDGWGNLVQETTNGVTTEFVLDENTSYTRILGEVRSNGGERLYAYGPEGFSAQLAVRNWQCATGSAQLAGRWAGQCAPSHRRRRDGDPEPGL